MGYSSRYYFGIIILCTNTNTDTDTKVLYNSDDTKSIMHSPVKALSIFWKVSTLQTWELGISDVPKGVLNSYPETKILGVRYPASL